MKYVTYIASDDHRVIFKIINNMILCGVISLLGIVSNVLNLVVFYKQGLHSTINISFFAMAISDLCSLVCQQCYVVFITPLVENSDLPIVHSEFRYIISAVPRETFALNTCLITVYVTAERCLCIALPLHVKQMITPRRTAIVISLIYGLALISVLPYYCAGYIDWKFSSAANRTLLGLVIRLNSQANERIVNIVQALLLFVSFLAVVLLTSVLIRKLGQKGVWRRAAVQHTKPGSMSNRDRSTVGMIALLASILIICYTPAVLVRLATFFLPGFSLGGKYYNLYYISWSFATLFETINSSVNIFLYIKMSTKYRETFMRLCYRSRDGDQINIYFN